jgi:hypothetical protein
MLEGEAHSKELTQVPFETISRAHFGLMSSVRGNGFVLQGFCFKDDKHHRRRVRTTIRSLSNQSGHQIAGRTGWLSRD